MRRLLLLAVVVGAQLATGCYCYRPYLPRLQSGFGCAGGSCGGSLFPGRPAVIGRPVVGVAAPPVVGLPIGADPVYGGGYPIGGEPGCVGCGSGAGVSAGYPISPDPRALYGAPDGYAPAAQGYPAAMAPMPMHMPSAMPGGVPHDSALLKMPTIMPPGPPSTSKRPQELARDITGRK
jgi:hypothetical protein